MAHRTTFSLLEEAASSWGNLPALHQPLGNGKYRTYDYGEFHRIAAEAACGLRSLGVSKGDIVALHAETSANFFFADFGVFGCGAVAAALYTTYRAEDRAATLRRLRPKAVFVDTAASLTALLEAGAGEASSHWILLEDSAPISDSARSRLASVNTFNELRCMGRRLMETDPHAFVRMRAEQSPEDPAVLYLTSGATGQPKMGLVSHRAVLANADMGPQVLKMTNDDHILVFLPSAHITQRVVGEFVAIRLGIQIWFSESLNRLATEMRRVRPTLFVAPPRLYERIHHSIAAEVKKKSRPVRALFYFAVGLGAEAARRKEFGQAPPARYRWLLPLLRRLVYRKVLDRLGGRVRIAASGGAPLGRGLAEFFYSIGVPLVEGYGLTEGGVTHLNPLDRPKAGSIGKPLPGVEAKLAEDGELLIKSPTLFSGYYEDPEASTWVLREDWLHTGDVAEIDSDGYFYITGRKKELIVASSGKKIYPSKIESAFRMEPLISQVFLVGDRLPYLAAIFTINPAAAENLPGGETLKGLPLEELVRSPLVQSEVKKAVDRVNSKLEVFEQIRKFRILGRDFTVESGELTPTMKLRRGMVLQNLRDVIAELYGEREEAAGSVLGVDG